MGTGKAAVRRHKGFASLAAATAFALITAAAAPFETARAQAPAGIDTNFSENAQLLLEADTLIYDNDNQTITASGNVRIDYDGIRMVAERVVYDRKASRMKAYGNVEIVDREGNRSYAQEIDITDDFADGFANSLRLVTRDKTYFGAASAERRDGNVTIFNRGVYTACEPCEDNPEKPPIWRIKAQKVIWNGKEQTIRFERASFELFGFPIATLPYFSIADHTVERKTGFLIPSIRYKDELGVGLSVPFYVALSPTYDLTVTGTGYTLQGFLTEAEWRQRFDNGQYNLQIAGIHQERPERFNPAWIDRTVRDRGMIASTGHFDINPRWSFGWNVLAQSDKNFARTYGIKGHDELVHRSEAYLTGLNARNFFDLRFMRFQIQERALESAAGARDPQAPWVLPSFDYTYTPDQPVGGGELRIDVNAQGISRSRQDVNTYADTPGFIEPPGQNVRGIEGESGRVTAEAEWKRSFIAANGLVFTPILHARGEAIHSNPSALSLAAIAAAGSPSDIRSQYYRAMATAGMEVRWPFLFVSEDSSHIIEPVAQIFVRPDAAFQDRLGIPNEDAQSLVFDASTLFERDKFSGYDRIEGGTRANIGLRYSGSFANGWSGHGLFGQSYQIAGDNPFAAPDLVSAGAFSGLDTDVSDFVGAVGADNGHGLSLAAGARFDKDSLDVRRASLEARGTNGLVSMSTQYAYIDAQPLYGFPNDRHEVTLATSARLHENWRLFGSGTFDFVSNELVRNSIGFSYDDECFTYAMTYSERKTIQNSGGVLTPGDTTRSIGFFVSFRTLGDFGTNSPVFE